MNKLPIHVIAISVCMSLFLGGILVTHSPVLAAHPSLDDLQDITSSNDPEEVGTHVITFTLPSDSPQINPSDYISFNFFNYTNIVAPPEIQGSVTGTPTYQVIGQTLYVTNITIPPGGQVTFNGIQAKNPEVIENMYVIIKVSEDLGATLVRNQAQVVPITVDPFVSVTALVGNPNAALQVSGFTAPYTYVVFNNGITTFGTAYTNPTGFFSRLFSGIPGGTHQISFYGIDLANRNTSTISMEVNTPLFQITSVSNQLLSPTLEIGDTQIDPGEPIYATGSAYPNTNITLFTDSPLRSYATVTDGDGNWTFTVTDTDSYVPGDYRIYALAQLGSIQSIFSPATLFTISPADVSPQNPCGDISEGDLDCNTLVNLLDFSILMYYWGTISEAADINTDGQVNLADFSIMMYYWGS